MRARQEVLRPRPHPDLLVSNQTCISVVQSLHPFHSPDVELIHAISNYNYGPAGRAIGVDLLNNPDLVATDPVVSFKTALWFWMTARDNKPSCHAVITGQWTPTAADRAAGRGAPGYGVVTNIINGGIECGHGADPRVTDRIGFYKRYCDILGIRYGTKLNTWQLKAYLLLL